MAYRYSGFGSLSYLSRSYASDIVWRTRIWVDRELQECKPLRWSVAGRPGGYLSPQTAIGMLFLGD